MTKLPEGGRCGWCHRPLVQPARSGRPRQFCRPAHRQRAYEARRRAAVLQVPSGQVIVSEDELQRVHDRIYRLEAALEDVDADLAAGGGPLRYRLAFEHLAEAARDVAGVVIEPVRQ